VYESQKTATSSFFIEWVEPKNTHTKLIIMLSGFFAFMAFSLFNWLGTESFGKSKLALLADLENIKETLSASTITNPGFETQLVLFELVLIVSAATFVASLILIIIAMSLSSTKARLPLAYTGFAFAAASPLLFIVTAAAINLTLPTVPAIELPTVEKIPVPTLYGFFSLIAAIASLVYCGRHPYLTAIRDRHNSFGTKAVTTFAPVRGEGVREAIRKSIFSTALICFVFFGVPLAIVVYSDVVEQIEQGERAGWKDNPSLPQDHPLRQEIKNKPAVPLDKYLEYYDKNRDFVGYIQIGSTRVDYPVLKTEDNDFYLNHNFDKKRNTSGAIFADYRNRFDGYNTSTNTVLYGHNISSGSFFAPLSNYWTTTTGWKSRDLSFYKNNPVIKFDTFYEELEWKVFACVLFNTEERFGEVIPYPSKHDFANEDDFHNFIFTIMDRSVLFTDVDIKYTDRLLTLSTCYYPMGTRFNTRLVVFARAVRADEGESSYVDVEKASFNEYWKKFEEESKRIRLGKGWPGHRVWDYKQYLLSYQGD